VSKQSFIVIGHKNPDTDSIVSAIVYRDYLEKKGIKAKSARAGELNKETKFIFSFLKVKIPQLIENLSGKDVVLVDHGELSQAADGIKEANILQVLDHHRMAGFSTIEPILYRTEPIGSTSTLIAKIFKESKLELNKQQAALLLAGVISDTLNLTSPTTTILDREIVKELTRISGLDVKKIAQKMFKAKSDLRGISINEILTKDYKEFNFSGTKVGISVYETVVCDPFEKMKEKIFNALRRLKKERSIELIFFAIVDILKQEAFMYIIGFEEEQIAKKAFRENIKENIMYLPGVVSRKKQMVPVLAKVLEK